MYMATFFDTNHKNKVGVALTKRIGEAVINGEMAGTEMPVACRYILAVIDTIKTNEDLIDFLAKLALRWPCFNIVLQEEQKFIATVQTVEQKFASRSHH